MLDSDTPAFSSINQRKDTDDRSTSSGHGVDRSDRRSARCDDVLYDDHPVERVEWTLNKLARTVYLGLLAHGECAEW